MRFRLCQPSATRLALRMSRRRSPQRGPGAHHHGLSRAPISTQLGPDSAATLLPALGDPERIRSERAFAKLCGGGSDRGPVA